MFKQLEKQLIDASPNQKARLFLAHRISIEIHSTWQCCQPFRHATSDDADEFIDACI